MTDGTCPMTGKRIMSRKDAMRSARWWRTARFARMNHYRCRGCDGWHIGNENPKALRRARRRKKVS